MGADGQKILVIEERREGSIKGESIGNTSEGTGGFRGPPVSPSIGSRQQHAHVVTHYIIHSTLGTRGQGLWDSDLSVVNGLSGNHFYSTFFSSLNTQYQKA